VNGRSRAVRSIRFAPQSTVVRAETCHRAVLVGKGREKMHAKATGGDWVIERWFSLRATALYGVEFSRLRVSGICRSGGPARIDAALNTKARWAPASLATGGGYVSAWYIQLRHARLESRRGCSPRARDSTRRPAFRAKAVLVERNRPEMIDQHSITATCCGGVGSQPLHCAHASARARIWETHGREHRVERACISPGGPPKGGKRCPCCPHRGSLGN